jgi:hypothetical protein
MKNKIAIASAFLAASSFSTAEIVINDFLSFEGFVDMSYTHTDSDAGSSSNSYGVDQVEVSWLFDFDPVTAQIDFTHLGSDNGTYNFAGGAASNNTGIEQAFVTYHMDGGSAITTGMYASMLGFEAFEPTGLYQYSTAYARFSGPATGTPGYVQGVKYTYEGDTSFFGISVQDYATGNFVGPGRFGGNLPTDGYGFEAAGSIMLGEGLTWFAGGAYEDADELGDAYVLNTYLTFETGAWIFAAELNYGEVSPDFGADTDGYSGLLMGSFAYSDQGSLTGRLSYYDTEVGAIDSDAYTLTLAHGWAFTDNLLLVTEISYTEEEIGAADDDILFGAVEVLFTF